MGRATSGVIGMRFRAGDELLAMMVARPDAFVFTATDGGFAKRTPVEEYPVQGRGGQGVLTAKLTDGRGGLVGALMVDTGDEVFAITSGGGVIRTRSDEVRPTSRATMGVRLINLADGDAVVGVTRNAEASSEVADDDGTDDGPDDTADEAADAATGAPGNESPDGSEQLGVAGPTSGHNGSDGVVSGSLDEPGTDGTVTGDILTGDILTEGGDES
jgi:DNA gyrase subunit A